MQYINTILGYEAYQKKEHRYKPYRQPGCKNSCSHEYHITSGQIWRVRKLTPGKTVYFCRECEYTTLKSYRRCYCCGTVMSFAHARLSKSRKINNESKVRY